MDRTILTRRTALALTALSTLVSMKTAQAAAPKTAIERLAERFARDMANGLTGFHVSPGPGFYALTPEQRAQAVLDMLEAGDRGKLMKPGEIDGFIDQPPRCKRQQVDLKELLRDL